MKSACFTAIILALFLSPASAHGHRHHHVVAATRQNNWFGNIEPTHYRARAPFDDQHTAGSGWPDTMDIPPKGWPTRHISGDPRPSAWCGWFMRQVKGVTDTAYNLARNWAHYGSPAGGPRVGAVVVWSHHVGEIVGECPSGGWLVHSGNDGHAVRTRCRSVAGAIAFRV